MLFVIDLFVRSHVTKATGSAPLYCSLPSLSPTCSYDGDENYSGEDEPFEEFEDGAVSSSWARDATSISMDS